MANQYLFPYLVTTTFFSKSEFFKKTTENVTIINKTEQVFIKEESSINNIVGKAASSMVNILSYIESEKSPKNNTTPSTKHGAGVIITSDGLIMTYLAAIYATNAQYKVTLPDSSIHEAELLGIDSFSNLAFLKIAANNLQAISLGNSEDIKPGEKVVAIGNNTSHFSNVFATGLYSNLDLTFNLSGKTVSSSEKLEGVLKSDFIYEHYFLGGPVIDFSNQIIGIIGSLDRDSKTEYFIIPSNKIKQIIDRVIKNEINKNPVLGIYYLPISKSLALIKKLPVEKGAWIYSYSNQPGLAIIQGLAAQKAGLRLNDIITTINNEEIKIDNSLADLLYRYRKGDQIELGVIRDGQIIKIKVQL